MDTQPKPSQAEPGRALPDAARDGSPGDAAARDRARSQLPAGRHGLTREQVTNSQRQRLIDAMAAVAAERGYRGTTISAVVERAGVSRATFYEIFRDKEACFVATMDEGLRRLSQALMPVVYAEYVGWPEKVRDVVSALLEFLASEPEHAKAAIVESVSAGNAAFERYGVGTQMIVMLLDQGRKMMPESASVPDGTARAVLGGGEALIADYMLGGRADRLPELLPDILYMALAPYLGQDEAIKYSEAAEQRALS